MYSNPKPLEYLLNIYMNSDYHSEPRSVSAMLDVGNCGCLVVNCRPPVTSHKRHGASDNRKIECLFTCLFRRTTNIKAGIYYRPFDESIGDGWIPAHRCSTWKPKAFRCHEVFMSSGHHQPWASYQIRNIAGCACAGNAGNVFPHRRFQRKPLVNDPAIHHGVRHARAVIACPRWRRKRSRHSRRMRTRNFPYLARGPCYVVWFADTTF